MKLITFTERDADPSRASSWRCGVELPGGVEIVDVARAFAVPGDTGPARGPDEYLDWFDLDRPWFGRARRALEAAVADTPQTARLRESGAIRARADLVVLAPVPRPGKIVCVGLNYRDHAREAKMDVPSTPIIFAKFATAVIGSGQSIILPAASDKVDYEAELGVIIGRRSRNVTVADAPAAVAGFVNANDVSARDFQKLDGQWVRAKSCDSFAPMGPAMVSADEVPDPGTLDIRLRVNGQQLQDSNTREFVFGVDALVAFLSDTMTLEPGDVILTGTPPGVGFARRPPVFLKPGDIVEVEIAGLGVLSNPVAGSHTTPAGR
jgi:2-keto-4-pentenoate hydratase/2-oxohepta-3-ene-1,7-dioic acid hydratase in catechol pathway